MSARQPIPAQVTRLVHTWYMTCIALYLRCICAVSVLYLALCFWYGGASGGVTVSVLYLYHCCLYLLYLLYLYLLYLLPTDLFCCIATCIQIHWI
jgi:hypothetical protein